MSIQALLCDFGGSLDADGVPWKDRFRAPFAQAGVALAPEALERATPPRDVDPACVIRPLADLEGTLA